MTAPSTSKSERAKRIDLYLEHAAQTARNWYDADGNWIATSRPAIARERYWLSHALYSHGDSVLADAVIRRANVSQLDNGIYINFDIFHTNFATALLLEHRDKMAGDVRQNLEERVREGFAIEPGNRRCDFQIHGYNDNMPAEATLGLILGGELLDEPAAVEHGLWNLRQFRALLYRRGIHSEWNSPTYSPVTLHCIAEIAEYSRHSEIREIALKIEERLWLDLAGRFHPEIGVLAGPHSRAYTIDAIAHLSNAASMLWFVLGDAVHPSPMELFKPESGLVLHHEGDFPFNVAQMCIFAIDAYHPPAAALELFARKTYPFRAIATTEQGDGGPDNPGSTNRLETVLEPDFAVGTSCIFSGSGGETYSVLYKRKPQVRSFRDVGKVYHKFVVNEDLPGEMIIATDDKGLPYSNAGEKYLISVCSMATLQSGTSVLVATSPQLSLGGLEDIKDPQPITRLNEMITFPSYFGGADEVRIGDKALGSWSGEAQHGEWIGCRRGRLLIAFRPLAYTADLGPARITLEKINQYEVIRITFYQGPARTFTRFELRRIFGGFIAEHASIDDYPSLAAFMEDLSPARFTDQYWTTRRIRYRRPAGKKTKALEMEISWSPGSTTTRFTAINGRPPAQDTRVQFDGLKESDFPFLSEPWTSVPSYFPWPVLRAAYTKIEGAIGDRET